MTRAKREGDGATPAGRLRALGLHYRADMIRRPGSIGQTVRSIRREDGWCDDPGSRDYNRPVRLPCPASHERMWRDDGLYAAVVDLSWNRGPRVPGRGSAIFLHICRPGLLPTEGCVAVPADRMPRLLARIGRLTVLVIR